MYVWKCRENTFTSPGIQLMLFPWVTPSEWKSRTRGRYDILKGMTPLPHLQRVSGCVNLVCVMPPGSVRVLVPARRSHRSTLINRPTLMGNNTHAGRDTHMCITGSQISSFTLPLFLLRLHRLTSSSLSFLPLVFSHTLSNNSLRVQTQAETVTLILLDVAL